MPNEPSISVNREPPVCCIGVIADTHIPDRVEGLHPGVLPLLEAAGVNHILHAGDISGPTVLETLRAVAPVTAVRGNRDFFAGRLEMQEQLTLGGVEIALMHGHHGLFSYLWDKWKYLLYGYQLERYLDEIIRHSGQARIVVYGHTHHPEILIAQGKLLMNPGSASLGPRKSRPPSIGLLRIYASGRVEARIQTLSGYRLRGRCWYKTGEPAAAQG